MVRISLNSSILIIYESELPSIATIHAFKVTNKVEIENCIKSNPKIRKQLRTISVNGYNKTENIAYDKDKFTIENAIYYIKTIVEDKTYSIENFNHLLEKNDALEKKNIELSDELEKIKNHK